MPCVKQRQPERVDNAACSIDPVSYTHLDALYSPVILITDALVTGVVMLLSASSGPEVRMFFGMSVGTDVYKRQDHLKRSVSI